MTLAHRRSDKVIIDEHAYDKLPVRKGDVVLDLGAHIGTTSRLVLDRGAARVIAVEADPRNVALLRRNLRDRRAVVMWAAVGPYIGRTTFYPRPDRTFLGSRIGTGRGIEVPMTTLGGLLQQYRPTIVKCDIEFGEYDLPELRVLPDHVRVLAMEVHIRYAGVIDRPQSVEEIAERRADAADLISDVASQGFVEVRRKDKQAKTGPDAILDDTGLPLRTKAVDAIWERA